MKSTMNVKVKVKEKVKAVYVKSIVHCTAQCSGRLQLKIAVVSVLLSAHFQRLSGVPYVGLFRPLFRFYSLLYILSLLLIKLLFQSPSDLNN